MTPGERHEAIALVSSELGVSRRAILALCDLVADRVASQRPAESVHVLDAAAVADRLAVERPWIYAHAVELGGKRIGGRWLFSEEALAAALIVTPPEPSGREQKREPTQPRRPRAERTSRQVDLLPIRGRGV